jgi:hypothetical protein
VRKTIAAVLCLLVLMAPAAASRETSPGVATFAGQVADAFWLVGKGKNPDFYFGIAERLVDMGLVTVAGVGKGKCRTSGGGGAQMMLCIGRGRFVEIPHEDFYMDPLLDSATFKLKRGGMTHTVEWQGRGDPAAGGDFWANDGEAGIGAGVLRGALPSGKVLGHKLTRRNTREADGILAVDAAAAAFVYPRHVELLPGGVFRYEVRLPL